MLKLATPMARARPCSFSFISVSNIAGRFMFLGRPMHQIEIDVIEPQLFQAGVERPADRVGAEIFVPDFCGDVQIPARDA